MTPDARAPSRRAADQIRARVEQRRRDMPIIASCPGCSSPIRHAAGFVFPAGEIWCPSCGGTAPIVHPNEPGAAKAYADAARVSQDHD
jgi:hypothetical protein